MNHETKNSFLEFNPQLQKELIALHPELQAVLDESREKKYFANWSSKRKPSNYSQADWKNQIISALDTMEVMEYYGVAFNKNGFASCPFHREKTASLSIKDNHYKCFGCGQYGSVIDFVMLYHNKSFRDAMIQLDNDFSLGITGKAHTLAKNDSLKRINDELDLLRQEHEEFRQYYLYETDIFRYLNKAVIEHAPTDPEQDPDEWHPAYIFASQHLGELEWWLDEYLNIYSDFSLYRKFKKEGRLPYWERL